MIAWWWILVAAAVCFAGGYVVNGWMSDGSDFDDMEESFWQGVEYGWMHPDRRIGGASK